MSKVAKGRVLFNGSTEQTGGEFVSGRQLLDLHVDPIKNSSHVDSVLLGPLGTRDFSLQALDRSLKATDAVTAGGPATSRSAAFELSARHMVSDSRAESLGFCGGCGTCAHNDGKDFNGYERHADRDDSGNARLPDPGEPTWTEGVLTVTVGGSVSGAFQVTGDEDQITVNLVSGQTYMVYLYGSGANAVTDTFLQVFAPDGTTLINEDDDGGIGLYSLITFTATTTGTYNLVASSFNNPGDPGLGDWTITVREQGADEAPSAPPSAVPVTVGLNYGFISPAGTDEDVYSINLTAGMIYNFEVAAGADYNTDFLAVPLGEVDTVIRIYDSAGTLLFTNDDIAFPDDISSAVGFIPETSGTYYVEIDGFGGQTGGYALEITETDLSTLNPLDAINWGGDANAVDNTDTLLIYFATVGQTFDGVTDLGGWTPYLQAQALAAFQTYSQFADLTFAITTNQAEADFTLVTTESDEFLAYFNPPGETNAGVGVFAVNGTGWDATGTAGSNSGSMEPGGYGWITLIHEFGHGLGMAHPHDNGGGSDVIPGVTGPFGSYGIFDLNQGVYTTMSYNDGWQFHPDVDANGFPVPDTLDYGYQGTPMAFDIALMQIKYGPVTANTGNNVYTLLDANVAGTFYQCIWDTGGTDEINYVGTADATIDLTAATLDYSATGAGVVSWVDGIFGGFTIAATVVIENATGGDGDDIIVGNQVANNLTGNGGNDTFVGGLGDDLIHGGAGSDTVRYFGNQADYTITAIVGGYTVTDNNLADGNDGTDTIDDITFIQFADGTVNLEDAPGNQAPTLTDLNPTVVFNENTVNAGPQLIDGDVTFDDSDGNFNGGTVTVAGALAEDVIAIRNEGTGVGQIGVSGANVTYGGVVIGTFTGGTGGTTLTITLNAAATSIAVDQLLENLTYANASGDPTLNRTLSINVTDSDGASLATPVFTPGAYVERTGAQNPLGAITIGDGPSVAMLDADNDGDLDVVLGDQPGLLRYFQNNAGVFTELTGASNPFDAFNSGGGSYTSPEAIDLDGDGDMDLAYGENDGTIHALRNNGNGTFTDLVGAGVNPFNGVDVGGFSDVAAGDFDGDGDMDLVTGAGSGVTANNGALLYFRNDGGGTFTAVTGAGNPFNTIDVGNFSSPSGGDVDGDGDIDLVVGNSAGAVRTFLNDGSGVFTEATGVNNPFDGVTQTYALPSLVDIDGDGFSDLALGGYGLTNVRFFENTSTSTPGAAPTVQVTVNAQNDAPAGANNSHTIPENGSYEYTAADFGFTDTDGDTLAAVVVTTLPTNGLLQLNGVNVTAGQVITVADINAGLLDFVPDTDEFGTGYATWTFQVRDNGGTANSGVDTDPSANTMTINVTPDNTAPTLTGFGPSVTFLENTVNATPQLLDADVTFADAEGNFGGGTLEVSGLLAEDTVGINNEGTGAGQIGVSGANVTYGGVVIGTVAGGAGADLVVTLNAAATSAAVDALIQNLTYANSSDTPTPSRTLSINVTDDEGLDLFVAGGFTEATGGADPLGGLPALGLGPNLAFVDVNNDGDLDIVVGDDDGSLRYFENSGAGYTEVTGAANPFDGFVGEDGGGTTGSLYTAPATIDIDGDGDLDLVVGNNYGYFATVQNNGNGTWTQLTGAANPLDGIVNVYFSDPTAIDYDGDGDMDIVSGSSYGDLYAIRNDGAGVFTFLTGVGRPFSGATFDVGSFSSAAAGDVDGDGDDDLVVGEADGTINTFINGGAGVFALAAGAANPFNGIDVGSYAIPTLVDIDGDGDDDLVVGDNAGGDTRVFLNNAGGTPTIVVNVTPENDIPVAAADAFTITEDQTISGDLFADNGSGEDEPGGTPLTVSEVNGSAANVGTQITLPSGALLTVNADGTFTYDPNGVFLPTPTSGSGASNTPANDSFTYTVAGGNTVTVSFVLTGEDTDDSLFGTAGSDMLAGGNGNDTYFVENAADQVIEATGQGTDIVYSSVSWALGAGSEVETLGTSNPGGNLAIALTGNEFGQLIIGNAGANFLYGVGGADTLDGGAGDDVIIVDSDDQVVEAVGGGNDLVAATSSYALNAGAEVETLSTINGGNNVAIALTGNEFGQRLIGNAGANFLYGFGGADILDGGAGDDVIIVDSDDLVVEAVGGGNDLVASSTSYALNAGAEVETLSTINGGNNVAMDLTGNEFGQTIIGNAGANFLLGGGGLDILNGGAGDDVIIVDADDQVVEAAGGGNDLVAALTSYTLNAGAEVETLSTTNGGGNAAINLTGNALGQTIIGNVGANVLDGKGGNDTLQGLGGADFFAFTTALGAGNVDTIADFSVADDTIQLDDAIFTAIGGLGTLNANAFVTGTAAADGDDRIIYNSATGQLFYDADGNGAGAAVQFATLSTGLALTASDFAVI